MTKVRYLAGMDVREMARMGGNARKAALSAAERRQIAIKASKAAARARKKKARQRAREARERTES
jgi:hypothetical protein